MSGLDRQFEQRLIAFMILLSHIIHRQIRYCAILNGSNLIVFNLWLWMDPIVSKAISSIALNRLDLKAAILSKPVNRGAELSMQKKMNIRGELSMQKKLNIPVMCQDRTTCPHWEIQTIVVATKDAEMKCVKDIDKECINEVGLKPIKEAWTDQSKKLRGNASGSLRWNRS